MFNNPINNLTIARKIHNNAHNRLKEIYADAKKVFNSSTTTTLKTTITSYSNYPQT